MLLFLILGQSRGSAAMDLTIQSSPTTEAMDTSEPTADTSVQEPVAAGNLFFNNFLSTSSVKIKLK